MSKICKKIIYSSIICFLFVCTINIDFLHVKAAGSVSISASKSTVAPGETFTVIVSVSGGMYKVDSISVENGSSNASSLKSIENSSGSFSVTAGAAGTVDISVSGPFATFNPEGESPVTRALSVNVVSPTTPPKEENPGNAGNNNNPGNNSNTGNNTNNEDPTTDKKNGDASLSELTLSQGTLSPEFNADTTDYSVSLGKDVTTLSINAKANNELASVSGTGEQTLKAGMNEFNVVCTAEDGSTRTYVVKVSVDESPSIFTTYNDKKLGVVKDSSTVSVPSGFEETKVTLEGTEINAWHNPLSKLTIVYLSDEANEKNFYLYDEATKKITSVYKPMGLLGRNIAVIDIPKELQEKDGMRYEEVEISGVKMMGWKFNEAQFEDYSLIYVMDEGGKMVYYLHEKSEDTLQLYSGQAAMTQEMVEEQASAMKQRMIMIIALLVTNIVTLGLLLIKVFKKPKRRKPIEPNMRNSESTLIREDDSSTEQTSFKSVQEEESLTAQDTGDLSAILKDDI